MPLDLPERFRVHMYQCPACRLLSQHKSVITDHQRRAPGHAGSIRHEWLTVTAAPRGTLEPTGPSGEMRDSSSSTAGAVAVARGADYIAYEDYDEPV